MATRYMDKLSSASWNIKDQMIHDEKCLISENKDWDVGILVCIERAVNQF